MNRFLRVLLWTIAIIAPGGIVLLPVLAGESFFRKASVSRKLASPARGERGAELKA